MEKIIYRTCAIILLLTATLQSMAQTIYKEQVIISSGQLQQKGDFVYLDMQIDMSNLKVGNQQSVTFTPVLKDANNRLELAEVIVNGSARHKEYKRAMALSPQPASNTPYNVLKSGKENRNVFDYSQTIPFEPWMADASLYLKSDLCGCGGHNEQSDEKLIAAITTVAPPIQEPQQPTKIIVVSKGRTESQTITVYFPVGISVIKEDFDNNSAQFEQMNNLMKELKSNKNINITAIEIEGYASPEGGVKRNEQLSEQRVQALKQYLLENFDLPIDTYNVTYGGENWDDLLALVEASSIDHKEDIISIIKNTEDVAQRKIKLETLAGGQPYAQMLSEFYPKLRKAICNIRIHYTIL